MDLSPGINRLPELNQTQTDQARAMMREEIALALGALSAAANHLDMPYETGEIEGTALRAITQSADRAVQEYEARCEAADAERDASTNPFEEPAKPHVHRFEYADDGAGNSGSFCGCGMEELTVENERRRIAHAAAYLPAVDLNALDPGAYKLLGNLARNDPYTNAVIRLVQHGGSRLPAHPR